MAKRRRGPLEPGEKRRLNRDNLGKLWSIARYLAPYKWAFIFGMICLVFSSSLLLGFPYLAGKLVDVASGSEWRISVLSREIGVITEILPIGVALISLLFFQSLFSFFRVYLFAQVNERAMADLRMDLFSRMIHLPMSFFDKTRVGELVSRITSDVMLLQDTFSITLAELFRQTATLIIGTIILGILSPQLTLFMFATFPILVIAALIFGNFIRKLSRKTQDQLASANIIVEESLQSVQVVKAFTNETFENHRYVRALKELIQIALKTAKYRGAFISFIIFVLFSAIVGLLWYGAYLLQSGSIESGSDLFVFVLYTGFIGGSIAGLGDLYGQLQRAIGASERIIDILHQDEEGSETTLDTSPITGHIEFEGVSFSYPGRPEIEVLHDLSFSVSAGDKIALVGPSGAGKSTIVQLLMRFYQINEGSINVDGRNIESFDLKHFRDHLGIVPQEVILFGGSIEENIAYGKPGATHEEIREAARKANALEFIDRFPEGMKTLVGERGVKLSGGQRQRIAIARAILKDPKILVLDEATSSLDAESEVLIQEALEELMKNRTSIIIAHRLSTIRKADRILVIQEGRIIESGTHEMLAEKESGLYRNLLELQFQVS